MREHVSLTFTLCYFQEEYAPPAMGCPQQIFELVKIYDVIFKYPADQDTDGNTQRNKIQGDVNEVTIVYAFNAKKIYVEHSLLLKV